ncbi:MAG: hypothetical protein K0R59_3320 [Sphingobacterium sp.]|jgi:hypothetical protein|nr:hypothetical protein [Sphingobacterium sp.]
MKSVLFPAMISAKNLENMKKIPTCPLPATDLFASITEGSAWSVCNRGMIAVEMSYRMTSTAVDLHESPYVFKK